MDDFPTYGAHGSWTPPSRTFGTRQKVQWARTTVAGPLPVPLCTPGCGRSVL